MKHSLHIYRKTRVSQFSLFYFHTRRSMEINRIQGNGHGEDVHRARRTCLGPA